LAEKKAMLAKNKAVVEQRLAAVQWGGTQWQNIGEAAGRVKIAELGAASA
jgi:hypothetical protein